MSKRKEAKNKAQPRFNPDRMAEQMELGNALLPCIRQTKVAGPPVAVGRREEDGSRMVLLPGLALKVSRWWRRKRVKINGVSVDAFLDPATGEITQVDLVAALPQRAQAEVHFLT